jgi:hypothetical protein
MARARFRPPKPVDAGRTVRDRTAPGWHSGRAPSELAGTVAPFLATICAVEEVVIGGDGHLAHPGARERLPVPFEALDDFADQIWIAVQELEQPVTHHEVVVRRVFDRAYNIVKGARLLLEHEHWELAASHVRQLFELLLDVEALNRAPDQEAAAGRYMWFGALQEMRHLSASRRYEAASGRSTPELMARIDEADQKMREMFDVFLGPPNMKGERRWAESWTGLTTKQLAALSTEDIRPYQYEVVYRLLSAHAHAAPMAVGGGRDVMPQDLESVVARDDRNTTEMISLLVSFFGGLWHEGRNQLPQMTSAVSDAVGTLVLFMGGPSQPSFD